jgi:hypothetical protein
MPALFIRCPATALPVETGRSAERDAPDDHIRETLPNCPHCGREHVWAHLPNTPRDSRGVSPPQPA